MSYGINITITPETEVIPAIWAAFAAAGIADAQKSNGTEKEAIRAVTIVECFVHSLLGALGFGWTEVSLNISGHANPGNRKRGGWANDFVQVNACVVTYSEQLENAA